MPRGPKGERRPADVIGNAVTVMKVATGEIEESTETKSARSKSGKAGGKARASKLTSSERSEIATKAAQARWDVGGPSSMNDELNDLLEKAKTVSIRDDEMEEHRIELAAANGHISDSRITVDTMRATRTIMKAAESVRDD